MSIAAMVPMARKKIAESDARPADGKTLEESLCRLGYCERVVKATEISKLVQGRGGKLSRQRLAQLLNSRTITEQSWLTIANGLGVTVDDLKRGGE